MNNSKLFKAAHKLARANVAQIGDYRLAFKWALSEVKAEAEKPKLTLGQKISYAISQIETVIGNVLCIAFFVLVFGFIGYWAVSSGEVVGIIIGSTSILLCAQLVWVSIDYCLWSLKENHRNYFR